MLSAVTEQHRGVVKLDIQDPYVQQHRRTLIKHSSFAEPHGTGHSLRHYSAVLRHPSTPGMNSRMNLDDSCATKSPLLARECSCLGQPCSIPEACTVSHAVVCVTEITLELESLVGPAGTNSSFKLLDMPCPVRQFFSKLQGSNRCLSNLTPSSPSTLSELCFPPLRKLYSSRSCKSPKHTKPLFASSYPSNVSNKILMVACS
ncbi:hypothetical protein QBC36DRAFT_129929 [Triangularia setosa]|uniref:Uncharacterized protein n=1 Tax=Triangularia setosa TaxID=2587417 RepID=A0AAN6W8T2_9PEZI|nr:hypothetical protein QBC36DRAFT_129929 [Podospora setosa]